jgi:diguanylate cyclase (GGDEF)-like protein/putative nucleotidyltransferase with HDIG domain
VPNASPAKPAYSPRLRWYLRIVIAIAVPLAVGAVVAVARGDHTTETLLGFLVFTVAAAAAELKPVPLDDTGDRTVSLAFVFLLASQVLFGWPVAVIGAVICMGLSQAVERTPFSRATFNTSVYALSAFLSAAPALLIGWDGTKAPGASYALVLFVFVGGATFVLANVLLIAIAVSLYQGTPLRAIVEDYVGHAGPAFAIMAFISALATALWKIWPPLEVLLAGPLFALALYQSYAYRSLVATRYAETDGLTGLRNHRSFQTTLHDALDTATSDGSLVSLVMLDIDDFKGINDRYGHPSGDQVLRTIAEVLSDVVGADFAFRVGGEEFALLLPERDGPAGKELLDTVHAKLEKTSFPHDVAVTISVGVAVFPEMAESRDALVQMADSALYWAKNHGKAHTCVYSKGIEAVRRPSEIAVLAERHGRLRAAESLIRIVDAKDTYTGEHSQSVMRVAEGIARTYGLDETTVEQVRLAALLHDMGKIAVPDAILQKAGKLDPDELAVLREHPELGFQLLEGLGVEPVDAWVRHHHEFWDGSGYPHGLQGEEIPLGSRIILVADAFDAMTSDRVYRRGGSVADAIAELRRKSWTQFDARFVAALEAYLAQQGRIQEPSATAATG